jgi:hypothetical protein
MASRKGMTEGSAFIRFHTLPCNRLELLVAKCQRHGASRMSISTSAPARRYITKRSVATRYNVTPRTVDRWKKAKILPPADRTVNGREYWNEGGLDEHDRQLVAELAATAK